MSTAASVDSGTSLSTLGDRDEEDHRHRGAQRTRLRAAAGGDDRAGPGRAGVDREGADQPRHDAAGTDAHEVAPGVDVVAALIGEGARRGGGLGHDDERDDGRERRQVAHRGPRQAGEPEVGGASVDGAEHGDAVRLQVQRVGRGRWSRPAR